MSIREESLTLYALDTPTDGTTSCPKCSDVDHDGLAVAFGDILPGYLGGAWSFECVCCCYRFEGTYVGGEQR